MEYWKSANCHFNSPLTWNTSAKMPQLLDGGHCRQSFFNNNQSNQINQITVKTSPYITVIETLQRSCSTNICAGCIFKSSRLSAFTFIAPVVKLVSSELVNGFLLVETSVEVTGRLTFWLKYVITFKKTHCWIKCERRFYSWSRWLVGVRL